jgi:geranylgeranyl pyrophosphate synthase
MIDKKNMYKTASYTFIRPMLTWAILAGVSSEQKKLISEFGKHLGLAFQVKDDMMDLTLGDKTKSVFKDIQEGQQTYFTNYIFNKGTWDQKQLLSECLGKSLNEEQIKKLQEMFESSGAIDFGKEMINDFISKAKWIFDQIDFSDEKIKQGLGNLMKKIEHF